MAEPKLPQSANSPQALVIFIHERYHAQLLLVAYSLTNRFKKDPAFADDLMQDFYFSVMNRWKAFKTGLIDNGYPYLVTALKNELINQNRKEVAIKRREKNYGEVRSVKTHLFNLCMDLYEQKFFEMLTQILSKDEFLVMEMYVKGFYYHEIAEKLNIKEGTVGSRIHRAKRKIDEFMESHA